MPLFNAYGMPHIMSHIYYEHATVIYRVASRMSLTLKGVIEIIILPQTFIKNDLVTNCDHYHLI